MRQEFLNNIFSFSNRASGIQKISYEGMVNTNNMIKLSFTETVQSKLNQTGSP